MERFVVAIVAGGVSVVAGLWLGRLHAAGSDRWLLGAGLVALGVAGVTAGIASELEAELEA